MSRAKSFVLSMAIAAINYAVRSRGCRSRSIVGLDSRPRRPAAPTCCPPTTCASPCAPQTAAAPNPCGLQPGQCMTTCQKECSADGRKLRAVYGLSYQLEASTGYTIQTGNQLRSLHRLHGHLHATLYYLHLPNAACTLHDIQTLLSN